MRLKNLWRLRFFINRYAPSAKKKRYMCNKLDELEAQVEKLICCGNCKNVRYEWGEQVCEGKCCNCVNYSNWEMNE